MGSSLRGGEKMMRALRDIERKIGNGAAVRVGFLEGSTYPDGTPVPLVAAANEFGDPRRNRPARPYFRSMVSDKSPQWGVKFAGVLKATDYNLKLSLSRMGEGIASQLRQSILDFTDPPLAESTIARKGFDKPLIDKSVMLNSVSFEVVDGPA